MAGDASEDMESWYKGSSGLKVPLFSPPGSLNAEYPSYYVECGLNGASIPPKSIRGVRVKSLRVESCESGREIAEVGL